MKKAKSSSNGNTKRLAASKHWVFTYNYKETNDICKFSKVLGSIDCTYVMQAEMGRKRLNKHLQGYICFDNKSRPFENKGLKDFNCHWEKCRSPKLSIKYCQKLDSYDWDVDFRESKGIDMIPKPNCLKVKQLYKWQWDLIGICCSKPDDRTIYWYWDEKGGCGKTTFCRFMLLRYPGKFRYVYGASKDIYYSLKDSFGLKGLFVDIPRFGTVNYGMLEQLKNGMFFSGKYESVDVLMPDFMHVIVFANFEPDKNALSLDRWRVVKLP